MNVFLLSDYSFGRITPLILCIVMAVYTVTRSSSRPTRLISLYFCMGALYHLSYILGYSIMTPIGAWSWILTSLTSCGAVLLVMMAYNFPQRRFVKESKFAVIAALLLAGAACGDYIAHAVMSPIALSASYYGSMYTSKYLPYTVMILYVWAAAVFMRQSAAISFEQHNNGFIKSLLIPVTGEAETARNFGLFIIAESVNLLIISVVNTSTQMSSLWVQFISNFFLLFVYSLYAAVFFGNVRNPVPVMHRMTGITLFIVCICVNLAAYIGFNRTEEDFRRSWSMQVKGIAHLASEGKTGLLPDDVEAVFKWESSGVTPVFSRKGDITENIYLWKMLPSIRQLYQHYGIENPASPRDGVRYFTQIRGANSFIFFDHIDADRYAVMVSYPSYRRMMHEAALYFLALLAAACVLVPLAVYIIMRAGILLPLQRLMIESRMGNEQAEHARSRDEFVQLFERVSTLAEKAQRTESLEKEFTELKTKNEEKKKSGLFITANLEKKLVSALEYVHQNYAFDISREGHSSSVGLTPTYFGKMFRAYTGKKFNEYINDLRIEDAVRLLETTQTSVVDIAFAVGFESLSTFNRAFLRSKGMTPLDMRNHKNGK